MEKALKKHKRTTIWTPMGPDLWPLCGQLVKVGGYWTSGELRTQWRHVTCGRCLRMRYTT
jgi:hypothetical protein